MKKYLALVLAFFLTVTCNSLAFEFVYDEQDQNQGAAFLVNPQVAVSGAIQVQDQIAIGLATPGDIAANVQYQQNVIVDSEVQGVAGNFTAHGINLTQTQLSGGITDGGIYGVSNSQQVGVIMGGINNGPTQQLNGSGLIVNQETEAGVAGNGIAGSASNIQGSTAYVQESSDPNGQTIHAGTQNVDISTVSVAGPDSVDADQTVALQAGASYTQNNGLGTSMQGYQAAGGAAPCCL